MKSVVAWFVDNSVAANLLMVAIIAAGALTLPQIRQEVFPETRTDRIRVSVEYPGAAPEEVEEGVTIRVEEQLLGIEGIKRVTSTSNEGMGTVTAELYEDADARRVLDEVKSRVDSIDTFPEDAEQPDVREVVMRAQVLNVAVSGQADERTLKVVAQRVRDDLSALPMITHVELAAARPYEISIEISEAKLRRHDLTFDEVVRAVQRASVDLPGGSIKTEAGEILLRSKGQAYRGHEFAALPLRTGEDGSRLLLGDVARVVDGFRETDQAARFGADPAVLVQVFRVGDQNALDIADAVRGYVAEAGSFLPEGLALTIWQDDSELLRSRRDLLLRNGRDGFILVLIVLALFLKARVALWVAAGVPIALLGTLWALPSWDVSINLLSLFAFIVVLGILVDDAIVTGENIFRYQRMGVPPREAAIRGTQEIATPVTFGVLTTMAAFAPMLLMPGPFGRIIYVIPAVVLSALFFSLVESKLILPSHLAHIGGGGSAALSNRFSRGWTRFQERFSSGLERFIERVYQPALEWAADWRLLTLAIAAAIFIVTLAFVGSGRIKFTFFPEVEGENVVALLSLPVGTPEHVTARTVDRLRIAAEEVIAEVDREKPAAGDASNVRHLLATIGEQPYRIRQSHSPAGGSGGGAGAHVGEVNLELRPSEDRQVSAKEIEARWRARVGEIPDAVELVFTSSMISTGDAIHVQLRGPDTELLRRASEQLGANLLQYPGVFDVGNSFRDGKHELKLRIRPAAEATGLSLADLGRQVRQAFYGAEIQRIQRGRDELRVMARFPETERRSLGDIENMRVRLADATAVPFGSVAEIESTRGFASIRRSDRQRVIDVTGSVDETQANANEILADLRQRVLPEILAKHHGVTYTLEGEHREQEDTFASIQRGMVLSLIAIFALLAIPLRSYVQPLIVMSAIPFGFVGAVWGHVLLGRDLSMLSIIGILAAAGVVVNDSLVLVSFANQRRSQVEDFREAVVGAGGARFRAILLTSLTTFLGLTPIMLEKSLQAQFLIPMAISLAYGVLFATLVTLFVVPAGTLVVEDVRRGLRERFRADPLPEPSEVA